MKTILIIFPSLVFCGTLAMADHFVSDKEGLARAVSSVSPGESIILQDGTWRDVQVRLVATGQADRPITLRAQTPGKVIGLWKDKRPTMTLPPKDCTFADNILLGTSGDTIRNSDGDVSGPMCQHRSGDACCCVWASALGHACAA